MEREEVSKLISYWLRHNPKDGGLEIDTFGWVKIEQVLNALTIRNHSITIDNLLELNLSFNKVRWEIDTVLLRIRALHGHSFSLIHTDKIEVPPETLYHGTAVTSIVKILKEGLLPMARDLVHLSEDIETAFAVGKRHGTPFIIEIATDALTKDGWTFYKSNNNVWMTTLIPPSYLSFEPWFKLDDYDTTKGFFLRQLRREIGSRKSHILYSHLDDLELVWNTGVSDDTLFEDKKTGKHYMVHLTFKKGEETEGYPRIDTYNSLEDWIENGLLKDQLSYYDWNSLE